VLGLRAGRLRYCQVVCGRRSRPAPELGRQESKSSGAFLTGLNITSPWRKVSPGSGRTTVQVPLGTFDVWVPDVRAAITAYAKELWPSLGAIPEHAWSLLAATGGRPRDVVSLLGHVKNSHLEDTIATADKRLLLNALLDAAPWNETFARYLLPSLLSVEFCAFENNTLSAFGADAPSLALLNADMLANLSDVVRGVPAISLRFARSMPYGLPALRLMVNALVTATNFCELDEDFERVWIGLQLLHLLLQHAVRMTVAVKVDAALSREFTKVAVAPAGGRLVEPNPVFWPIDETFKARDFPLPTTEDSIDVFAPDALPVHRINALFPSPNEKRVHVAAGASIHRKVSLRAPLLAVWHDLWSPTVAPGSLDALPPGWPVEAVVEWKEGTLVYFDKSTNRAVTRSASSDVFRTLLSAADACRRRHLPSQPCLRRTTA
jgi:hypothetical protein